MATPLDIAQGFYAAFSAGEIDAATALFSDRVQIQDPGLGSVQGKQAMRDYLTSLKGPMPDANASIERTFESAGFVIAEGRFTGTNTGPLPGEDGELPPSGRAIDLPFADFSRVVDELIVEYRTYYDQLGLMQQLGLMD